MATGNEQPDLLRSQYGPHSQCDTVPWRDSVAVDRCATDGVGLEFDHPGSAVSVGTRFVEAEVSVASQSEQSEIEWVFID